MSETQDKNIFSLYYYGMKIAIVNFGETGIYIKKRCLYSDEYSDYRLLDNDEDMVIPLKEIQDKYIDYIYADKTQDSFVLGSGERYEKYKRYSGTYKDKISHAQMWVQRGVPTPLDVVFLNKRLISFYYAARGGAYILAKDGYEQFTPMRYWLKDYLSPVEYGLNHMGNHMIPMRDGTCLDTEIWCPENSEDKSPKPTILIRTPYGRQGSMRFLSFVERGYNVVIQDVRGREGSEGLFYYHSSERDDGSDTIDWISNQPWSNGDVGMIGASYLGYVQWAAASSGNPKLKALVSIVTSGSPFGDIPRQGGTIMSGTLAWSFAMKDKVACFDNALRDDWDEIMNIRPLTDITTKVLGEKISFWDENLLHPDNDNYWKAQDWTLDRDKIKVPAMLVSGWYDDDGRGTSEAWKICEESGVDRRLILGPWLHGLNTMREINNIDYGRSAIDHKLEANYLKWFDKYLKNMDNDVTNKTVSYYIVNKNKWYKSDTWPPQNATSTPMYINSYGKANTSSGDGTLNKSIIDGRDYDSYNFNPENPTPFLIDISENELNVPENYRYVELRNDVLVYTSDPLSQDLTIAGEPLAMLYASSSALDTDWVVRITDVSPQGDSIRVSDGLLRARYRDGYDKHQLLEPNKVEEYRINMTKIATTFKAGHRIRVEITSGMKNFAFPNHNTGNDPATDTEYKIAKQKVYHSKEYPTHVVLPVMYDL